MARLIEGGHYYADKGATIWSIRSWEVLQKIKKPDDKTLIFVDDIHPRTAMAKEERDLETFEFNPAFDFQVFESSVCVEAKTVLALLQELPKKKRARKNSDGRWFVSDFALTDSRGFPLCVLLDAGLTLRKQTFGYSECVNVLPYFYEEEQRHLLRIIDRIMPNFHLEVVFFNLEGEFWNLI
ncbi:MAG TPA: hypothetical protein PLV72_01180 [Candidatus Magasanikbacteria bacterium]|nr:hypothetical protein [Candidatus Magasanikbacteria bacterium]